jgi:hypothetical protein
MAMQVPMDCDLAYFRKLWKKPTVNHGDWLIKDVGSTKSIFHRQMTDADFKRSYREPY